MRYAMGVWAAGDNDATGDELPMVIHRNVGLGDLADLAGAERTDVRCSLPLDVSPRIRRRFLAELDRAVGLHPRAAVEAPVAAFAASPPGPTARSVPSGGPQLHAVALGHPDGSVSLLVADRISAQLAGIGLVGDPAAARLLMRRAFLACVPAENDVGREVPDEVTEDHYSSVTGYGLDGDAADLVDDAFGAVPVERRPLSVADACLVGLARLSRLAHWSATWPTAKLHVGGGWTRHAGPLDGPGETHLVRLGADRVLRFSDATGTPLSLRAGSILATGCAVPSRLGAQPRLQLLDDGRLLLNGPGEVPPLAARLRWPIPGSGSEGLVIASANRFGLELVEASVRPQQLEHVEPQPSGQPQ